jgi:hypothetical protein
MAEREGFEPSVGDKAHTRLAGEHLQPARSPLPIKAQRTPYLKKPGSQLGQIAKTAGFLSVDRGLGLYRSRQQPSKSCANDELGVGREIVAPSGNLPPGAWGFGTESPAPVTDSLPVRQTNRKAAGRVRPNRTVSPYDFPLNDERSAVSFIAEGKVSSLYRHSRCCGYESVMILTQAVRCSSPLLRTSR